MTAFRSIPFKVTNLRVGHDFSKKVYRLLKLDLPGKEEISPPVIRRRLTTSITYLGFISILSGV